MYKITLLPHAEASFKKLDKTIQLRIAEKIDWLSENADKIIHHTLKSLPDDLKGLCRMRVGDYRVISGFIMMKNI
ncbi:MAG: type II toxin-antitoxin system mRNA interferase toxin, RelE/StbE family [Nitrospirota bacterium]